MKNTNKLVNILVPLASVLLAFLIGCIIMLALGANPLVALQNLWVGAFGSLRNLGTTLSRATPLIFTGLCACFAYRCGVFNLGGEGQFIMGSIVCCVIATQSGITGFPGIVLCLVAGALAGLMTETNTIAFIGGMELDTTKGKYEGYVEAATYVGEQEGKTVTALDIVYSGDFSASDKGIEYAKAMIDQGADVFFSDASAVDSGARQAIDEANAANGSVTIYDIAQPSDLLGQNECIIGSQVTDNSSMVGLCMQAVADGSFGGEVIYGTLQNGALSAGALSDLVPAEKQEAYQNYIQQMIDGTFMQ